LTENLDVASVALRVEVDHPNFDLPVLPPGSDGNYYLIIDDDGDFTNGGTTELQMSLISGDVWETLISDPSDSYFTFGVNSGCIASAPTLTK